MQAARSARRVFPWLWTVAVAVTALSVVGARSLGGRASFYRSLSVGGLSLGVGLLLLATGHTVQDQDFRRRRRRLRVPAPRATSEAGSGTGA